MATTMSANAGVQSASFLGQKAKAGVSSSRSSFIAGSAPVASFNGKKANK